MAIHYIPSTFNYERYDEHRDMLGMSFVPYYTTTYAGHSHVKAEIRGDATDYTTMRVIMQNKQSFDVRVHHLWLATMGLDRHELMAAIS